MSATACCCSMKHSFNGLTKVSKAYVTCLQDNLIMEFDNVFMWIGYAGLGMVLLWFLLNKCWKYSKNYLTCGRENLEVIIHSTCSTSSSFTYVPSVKPHYSVPHDVNDGLSDFDNSILFDQPMTLNNVNPYCKQNAEKDPTSPEASTHESSSVTGRRGPVDDDHSSMDHIVNIFNNSVLSLSPDEGVYSIRVSDPVYTDTKYEDISPASLGSYTTQYSTDISIDSMLRRIEEIRRNSMITHGELVTDV